MESYCLSKGFNFVPIKGDGNCLFRAISYLKDGTQNNHMHYRNKAVSYMKNNQNMIENFLESDKENYHTLGNVSSHILL